MKTPGGIEQVFESKRSGRSCPDLEGDDATCRTWNRCRWAWRREPAPSVAAPTGPPSSDRRDSRRAPDTPDDRFRRSPMLCPWRSPHASMKSRYSTSAHRTRIPEPVGTTSPLASSSNSPDSGSTEYASARNRSCSSGYPAAYESSPSPSARERPAEPHPALQPEPDPPVGSQTEHVVPGPRSRRRSGERPRPRSLLHRAAADDRRPTRSGSRRRGAATARARAGDRRPGAGRSGCTSATPRR